MSFEAFYEKTKADIDETLERLIKDRPDYERLKYALEGGKRLRPVLAILVFKALGGRDYPKALEAAAALEIQHSASLVHDNIVDLDRSRRGKPAAYRAYGVPETLMLGHRMVSLGLLTVINHGAEVVKTFLKVWDASLKGETKDVEIMAQRIKDFPLPVKSAYFSVIKDKTASLFAGSCKVGAQEAGASEELQDLFWKYGEQAGIAYQLADDWVDMKKGKIETLPYILIAQLEESLRRSIIKTIEEERLTPDKIALRLGFDIEKFFDEEIGASLNKAAKMVEPLEIPEEYKDLLMEAPLLMVERMLGGESLELRIKKDGSIILMGKEIGKVPHTLEKVKRVFLVIAGVEPYYRDFIPPTSIEEIGLDIYTE